MTSKLKRIAIIVPMEMEYSGRLVDGAIAYANQNSSVSVTEISYPVDDPDALQIPTPFHFDGALVWATPEAPWIETLLKLPIPLISASGDIAPGLIPCISFDHQALVDSAVNHLALYEPKTLVYLQFVTKGIPIKEARRKLFEKAAARHGITARSEEILYLESEEFNIQTCRQPFTNKAAQRLRMILKSLPPATAIWCGDDDLALRVCETASDLGLRIPQELAVLGLGDFRSAKTGDQKISSIPLPGENIGFRAANVLDQKLSDKVDFPNYIPVIAPPVVIRDTTINKIEGGSVSRALAIIAASACDNLTVRDVAKQVSLTPQTLHSRFVERIGHSPGAEIRKVKLAIAKSHLRNPQLTISSISTLSGYSEQNKFSNFFKRETGISPRQWRAENA